MPTARNKAARVPLVVVVALALVHCINALLAVRSACAQSAPPAPAASSASRTVAGDVALPPHVSEMRDMILQAVRTGRLEDLQAAIDLSELPPEFGAANGVDPIAHLRSASGDGMGREILAVLGNLLLSTPAHLPIGRDVENNTVYVWPAVSEANLDKLTPAQEVDLYRLMPVAEAKTIVTGKKWTWWRLAIGADGTWLTFMKHNEPAKGP